MSLFLVHVVVLKANSRAGSRLSRRRARFDAKRVGRLTVDLAKGFLSKRYIFVRAAILIQLAIIAIILLLPHTQAIRASPLLVDVGLSASIASPLIFFFLSHSNIIHLILYVAIVALSNNLGLLQYLPAHGIVAAAVIAISGMKFELTLDSPLVERAVAKGFRLLDRVAKRSALPATVSELKIRILDNILVISSLIISTAALLLTRTPVLAVSFIISFALFMALVFGFMMPPGRTDIRFSGRGLLRVYRNLSRYRSLQNVTIRLGRMIERDIEVSGLAADPMLYAARYLIHSVILLSISPTIYTLIVSIAPSYSFIAPIAFATPLIPIALMKLSLYMAISSRRSSLEKIYPFFTIVSAISIINGVRDMEKIFESFIPREKKRSRFAELLPALEKEAQILLRYIRILGLTPMQAIDRYISYCPSESFKSYMRGYVNQLAVGTPLKDFAVKMVLESLDLLKRRLESLGMMLNTLVTMFITVLTFPILPLIIGIILNPGASSAMIFSMLALGGPLSYVFFSMAASKVSVSFPNKLPRARLSYPAAGLIIGTIAAIILSLYVKAPISIAFIGILIPFFAGLFIDFRSSYKEISEVEKNIVVFLNTIADLVELRPIGKALEYLVVETERSGASRFSQEFMKIVKRMASYAQRGDPLAKAEWFSGSWIMRLTQFVMTQVEATGERAKEVMKILAWFLSDYLVIVKSTRSRLTLAVGVMMAVPVILVLVLTATLGIIGTASSIIAKSNVDIELLASQVRNIPIPPQVLQAITGKGVDPFLVTLIDFLIVEVGIVLAIAAAKSLYGTMRAAKIPLLMSIVILILLLLKPYMASILIPAPK